MNEVAVGEQDFDQVVHRYNSSDFQEFDSVICDWATINWLSFQANHQAASMQCDTETAADRNSPHRRDTGRI